MKGGGRGGGGGGGRGRGGNNIMKSLEEIMEEENLRFERMGKNQGESKK